MKLKLGMRTIKTGLAIYFSLLLCNLIGLKSGALAAITAVVSIQPSLKGSLKDIKNRGFATIFGCIIAVIITYFFQGHFLMISLALGAILIIWVCVRLGWQDSVVLLVITIILVGEVPQGDFLSAVQNRIIMVFIGIGVAFFLNFIIPPRHTSRLIDKVDQLRKIFESFYGRCIDDILQTNHLSREEVKEYTQKIRNLLYESREIFILSIDSKIGYNEDNIKDEHFLIRKAINAIQSNLERLLEIHRSIIFAPKGEAQEEICQHIHHYLSSIFIYHQKIYDHILFGKQLENPMINEFAKEEKKLQNKILKLVKEATDLSPLEYYNIVSEGQRIINKAWSLIENKERFDIKVE